MKLRLNPLLLGAFITGALAIVVSALLGLGTISFHSIGTFVLYLPKSTSGVTEGTAVKLAGVRIGEVQSVRIFYDRDRHKSFVAVICRIKKDLLEDVDGHAIKLTKNPVIKKMVKEGLFAQIQTSGLVGAKFVELDFNAPAEPIHLEQTPDLPYPVVPSVPSKMSELSDNVSDILDHLRQIDFSNTIQQVNATLASARGQIMELQTNQLTDHVSAAAKSFGDFMSSADLRQAITRLQLAAASFQTLVTNVDAQVRPAGTNLDATLASARRAAADLDDLLTLRNQLGEQTHELLEQLNQTSRAIEQLADFVKRHPNALITGRAKPRDTQ